MTINVANILEFKKHFDEELRRPHMIYYHTYPKTPQRNVHLERFNKTLQDDFINFRYHLLKNNIDELNRQTHGLSNLL